MTFFFLTIYTPPIKALSEELSLTCYFQSYQGLFIHLRTDRSTNPSGNCVILPCVPQNGKHFKLIHFTEDKIASLYHTAPLGASVVKYTLAHSRLNKRKKK